VLSKNMRFESLVIIASALTLATTLYAAPKKTPTPKRALLALSKENHMLSIVDPDTLKVIARMPVGPDPHEVIASSDGKKAYVSNMGGMGAALHELDVIDLVAQKSLHPFDTGALIGPHGLDFADGKVWFTAQGAKSVGRYDPATGKIDWIMGTGQDRTHMIYVTKNEKDAKQVYTTNVQSATVSILENILVQPKDNPTGKAPPGAKPHMEWTQTVIPVGKGSEGFDVSPDGHELWTAGSQDGTITVIETASKKVTATLDAKVFGANRLKFTPDGKTVLISSLRTGELIVYDVASRKEVKRISIGKGGSGILIDGEGQRAFIGCTPDDYVAVVDLGKLEMTGKIDVGGKPDGLAWANR
jgi:DNA-binding beta-propeller fold protein YncE